MKFLKSAGGINAVISYLEYICLECGPTRNQINENALYNKKREQLKKGIIVQKASIHEQMLKQQDDIYAATPGTGFARSGSSTAAPAERQQSGLEHVSAEELEQWEISHTELGCLYVEYTQKQLQRFRNSQTAELDLERVEASKSVQVFKKPMMTFLEKSDLYIAHQILELLPDDYLHQ